MRRYALKRDRNEPEIIEALMAASCEVHRLQSPVDLLVRVRNRWELLEVKLPGANRNHKTMQQQRDFIARHAVPIVETAEQALKALGLIGSTS